MRKECILLSILIVLLSITAACGWSPEQREILNSFNDVVLAFENEEWNQAGGMMTSSTMTFLDSVAADLTHFGLEGYSSGIHLLSVMYDEYIDFDGDVTMIFVQGGHSIITVSSIESVKYAMLQEEGDWKLDLEHHFRRILENAFQGSYLIPCEIEFVE